MTLGETNPTSPLRYRRAIRLGGGANKQSDMNRHELIEKVKFHWDNPNGVEDLTDFILENFDPKQPATERVSAKECYLMLLKNHNYDGFPYSFIAKKAHVAAEAFNNYKPESHE